MKDCCKKWETWAKCVGAKFCPICGSPLTPKEECTCYFVKLGHKHIHPKKGIGLGIGVLCSICYKSVCFCPERQSNGDWKELPKISLPSKIEAPSTEEGKVINQVIDYLAQRGRGAT